MASAIASRNDGLKTPLAALVFRGKGWRFSNTDWGGAVL
jgi:hypothetical protein